MHPTLDRIAEAYRPLAGRNRLVEGPLPLPPATAGRARGRITLLALVAVLSGRRR